MTLDSVKEAIATLRADGRTVSQNAVLDLTGGSKRDLGPLVRQALQELDGTPGVREETDALAVARARLAMAEAALTAALEALETCRAQNLRLAQQHMILQHAQALDLVWKNAERDAALKAEIAAATHRYQHGNDRLAAQHEALSQARAAVVAAEQGAWLRTHHPALAAQLTAAVRDYQEASTPGSRIMYKAIIREKTAEANALWAARVTG